tara:strand:+ start:416 stop:607 length:192 start_codon:yes stop_codon:yes gene_type:complete
LDDLVEDVEEVEVEEVDEEEEFSLSFIVERSTTLVGVRSTTTDVMDTLTVINIAVALSKLICY